MTGWFARHKNKLWWLHSFYALMLGIVVIWLGNRNFAFLRVAVFHLSFIWLSSLLLPKLLGHPRLSPQWAPRLRLVINFFNKNLYQQMLFFVLPIYYGSATLGSRNIVFVLLVGLSATLSSLDVVYDRHLSVKRGLTAAFFAFNLFALINVMLPILWSVSNTLATRLGAGLAVLGFLSLYYSPWKSGVYRAAFIVAIASMIVAGVELGRPFIPPAPLSLTRVDIGTNFERESLRVADPLTELQSSGSLRLYGVTAVKAPLGLKERLRHRWHQDGKLVFVSPLHEMVGGREQGFRLWTSYIFGKVEPGTELRLDLETEGGQLVGRADLKASG